MVRRTCITLQKKDFMKPFVTITSLLIVLGASIAVYLSPRFLPLFQSESSLVMSNIECLSINEGGINYKWSHEIDCPGWFTGDYRACVENGPGNECDNPGAKTCECGVNC